MKKYRADPSSFQDSDNYKLSETVKKKSTTEQLTGRAKWVKQPGDYSSSSSDDEDDMFSDDDFDYFDGKATKVTSKKRKGRADKSKREKVELEDRLDGSQGVAEKQEDWTAERIDLKTKELLDRRGTKNYDRLEQVKLFEFLIEKSKELPFSVERYLKLAFHLINAQFDASPNMAVHMTIPMWKKCYNNIVRVLDVLKKYKNQIRLVEHEPNPESDVLEVRSPLLSQIERLHEEFLKSLQAMDEYTQEYVNRLKHESALLKLTKAVFDFYDELNDEAKVAVLASRLLDHLYYKREIETPAIKQEETKSENEVKKEEPKKEDGIKNEQQDSTSSVQDVEDENLIIPNVPDFKSLRTLLPELCQIIYRTKDDLFPDVRYGRALKTKAILQHIYHLALHDQYYEARDMMLMTRMYEIVNTTTDPSPKILYNRALVQIGLAAFRNGLFSETQIHLSDFMSSNKYREWLAQGVYKSSDKTPEEERIERLRQVPYPMHINLDLLEFAHLASSMLHDVTNIFLNDSEKKKSSGSKGYKKLLDQAEKNLSGPPESIKENIVAATNALKEGNWKKSSQYLLNLDVWKLIPNADHVKSVLETRIKEESLRAFILTNANYYVSVSLEMLSSMFELPQNKVHSIICKMIINGEFNAHVDQTLKCYITRSTETTPLSMLIKQLSDCVGSSEGLRGNLKDKEITAGGKKAGRR